MSIMVGNHSSDSETVCTRLQAISRALYAFVDWFIPEQLRADASIVQSVRMFLFSHIFGPFLGHTISIYILFVQGRPDLAWWVFFGSITLFWPYTFVLRATGLYVPLALMSIQNLMFCILWGCYHYGGINSPILPWLITVPLLAFFYLPTRKTRIIVSLQILGNLTGFFLIYSSQGFLDRIPLDKLVGLGIVSTFCAGVYVSMMALYYASTVSTQSELEQEIARHRMTERQLREAIDQVERATQAKSIFLAKMSHELRTPLNAVIGYSEMLLEESASDNQKREDLTSIKDAGRALLELVNNLLDLSKLGAGKMELYLQRVSLDAFAADIDATWRQRVVDAGNQLVVYARSGLGTVVVDAAKLRQAVDNLILNAIKNTNNGHITVAVSSESGLIIIAVRDTGTGMSSQQVATAFETFGRQDGETSSSYVDDPGLGLPLSRKLCQLMDGDISAESEPARGSCFTIRVPCKRASVGEDDEHQLMAIE
jgi:signal transduction histidine kinase